MGEKIKYYEIQEYLYKKLLSDFQEEQNRNERLKHLNRKMLRKIDGINLIKKKQNHSREAEY